MRRLGAGKVPETLVRAQQALRGDVHPVNTLTMTQKLRAAADSMRDKPAASNARSKKR